MMFTKGTPVTYIGHWSDVDGSSFYRQAIIHSCGMKKMVLTDAVTGEEMGRNFKPGREQYSHAIVVARLDDEAALAAAEQHSAEWIAREIAELERILIRSNAEGESRAYRDSLAAKIERLKAATPSARNNQGLRYN